MASVHLVARAYRLPVPLTHPDVAPWLWSRLVATFTHALAAILMPNHLHLLTLARDAAIARARLASVIGAVRRTGGVRAGLRFEPVPTVSLESDPQKALRQGRYILLNPVRKKLVADPLTWRWSTHRDVLGAVAPPWVTAARLAAATGRDEEGFAAWWQGYVAREDGVPASARILTASARITAAPDVSLQAVAAACASALRTQPEDVRRRGPTRELFLALACRVGWDHAPRLAAACDVTARAVQRARPRPPPAALAAALLCLGDARLRT